jgi:Rrf2 family cysteine metabolism transcriptional repressor
VAGISAKSLYGVSALLYLSKKDSSELTQIKEIATESNVPQGYLEQILPTLKNFGLIESVRGANGGYRLSKNPRDIFLFEIISALEGGICEANLQNTSKGFALFLDSLNIEVRAVFSKSLFDISEFVKKADEDFVYII